MPTNNHVGTVLLDTLYKVILQIIFVSKTFYDFRIIEKYIQEVNSTSWWNVQGRDVENVFIVTSKIDTYCIFVYKPFTKINQWLGFWYVLLYSREILESSEYVSSTFVRLLIIILHWTFIVFCVNLIVDILDIFTVKII